MGTVFMVVYCDALQSYEHYHTSNTHLWIGQFWNICYGSSRWVSAHDAGCTLATQYLGQRLANNESSEVCGIIKPGRRVKFKCHRH